MHVSKEVSSCKFYDIDLVQLLAIHSPVFEILFFGDFAEKGKAEIDIKDVVFEVL